MEHDAWRVAGSASATSAIASAAAHDATPTALSSSGPSDDLFLSAFSALADGEHRGARSIPTVASERSRRDSSLGTFRLARVFDICHRHAPIFKKTRAWSFFASAIGADCYRHGSARSGSDDHDGHICDEPCHIQTAVDVYTAGSPRRLERGRISASPTV